MKKFNANTIKIIENSGHPYVVRTGLNNGIKGYIKEDEKYLNEANTISFGQDTATMFYQDKAYFTGDKIKILKLKDNILNEKIAMFLLAMLHQSFKSFNWGVSSFDERIIKNNKVLLPIEVDAKGKPVIDSTHKYHNLGFIPNFHYMEERISELMEERISELNAYLKVSGLIDYELTKEDKEILNKHVSLVTFKLEEVFDIVGTKSLDAGAVEFVKEGINFVGRTGDNNGVQGKIAKQKFGPNEANTITATVIGNYKYVKYQQEPYYCSQNINKLTLKAENTINEDIALYLMSNIYKFVSKYNGQQGGYKLDDIKNHIISLPIKNNASAKNLQNVDFDYMEKYIKVLKKIIIEDVVKYKDRVIDETKNVISNT